MICIQQNAAISSDLILDLKQEQLFIMTHNMLQKRPVAECQQHPDCHSCLLAHDPYCGWCVLQGRCVLQSQCPRGNHPGQWLWSFDMEQQCLVVQDLNPSNLSREESRMVSLFVPGLPVLEKGESYSCFFQNSHSPATVTETGVTCHSPDMSGVPMVLPGQDFVTVTLSLRFGNVTVTARDFTFYDCTAVKQLSGSQPCHGCVLSRWGCNWCVHQHSCTHKPYCKEGVIIYNQHFKLPTSSPPTTKTIKVITTATTTTATPTTTSAMTTTTTAVLVTIVTTQEPTTPPPSHTTTSPLPTHPGTTLPPQPPTLPPSTAPGPEVTTRKEEGEASEMIVVTHSNLEEGALTPSVIMAAAELTPITVADGLSGDLDPVMPLMIPDSSPLEAVTGLPPSERQAAGETVTLEESPTMARSGFPLPTPFPVGEPADSEPFLYLDLTQTPTLLPLQDLHTEAGSPTTDPNVLLWPKEADHHTEGAVQAENDTATFSAATVLSGDGEVDHIPQSYPQLLNTDSELDYQYDPTDGFLPGDEGSYVSWGSSACPCVEKVQGSSLLPVRVERKITLLAHNLHLYQDAELDYECVLVIEGQTVVVDAFVEPDDMNPSNFDITCQLHQYTYSAPVQEYNALVYVKRRDTFHVDSSRDLYVTLYNCSVGRSDCSRCHTADQKYGCVWCGGPRASCLFSDSCSEPVQQTCPAPVIHSIQPLSGLLEGGTMLTISGSNLGQKAEEILHSVLVEIGRAHV